MSEPLDVQAVPGEEDTSEANPDAAPSEPGTNRSENMGVDTGRAEPPALPYPLVAVGASAGGLQAFRELLENLPERTGMTFVLVTHLAPDQRSYLTEIMERHTSMPVQAIENGKRPEPDNVYILPPNQYVEMRGGRFLVTERGPDDRAPATINRFFRSVATDQRNLAIGVVLSGADSDGASGLKAIKGEGGFSLVQTPESAVHGSMPRNSIVADHVDMVLPPAEIALELARLAHQFARTELLQLERGEVAQKDERAFQDIIHLLRNVSGLELRLYKPETLRRRMSRRMMLQRIETVSEYLRILQVRPEELRKLQEDILINVTRFFRDPELWETLQTQVLPTLLRDRSSEKPLRIWCAGCSSGEEAYSLAIALLEYTSQHSVETPIQIFGTDASERAIEMARNATYPETLAGEMSPERIRRFFVKTDRGFQIAKRVRDLCVFARQNLCNDPPFSHIDLLSCRNVMIYFTEELQRRVLGTFHYALEPGGYMLLGLSEGLRDLGNHFLTVDRKNKIYTKTGGVSQETASYRSYRAMPPSTERASVAAGMMHTWPETELQRTADHIALGRFAPPGMIVDEQMNVLQLRGDMSPFIAPGPGAVTWNLQRVLRENIAAGVWQAVHRARSENLAISTSFLFDDVGGTHQHLHVDVLPIVGPTSGPAARCFLVFLREGESAPLIGSRAPLDLTSDDERDQLISQQEQDLSATRFHLQSLIQERDSRNQELVSANEEIQTANEELQSTNEELGTTKEELQSANEELQTINDELQQRNLVLSQTGNDLNNLLTSVNIPLLMLTSDLRIRQFTPPVQRLLSVRTTDIGRPIGEIKLQFHVDDLEAMLHEVLDTLSTRELEVKDTHGHWHLLRIRPYRTSDDRIEGLVLILMDINQLRSSQQEMLEARDFARSVVECVPLAVTIIRENLTVQSANTAFRHLVHLRSQELEGRLLTDIVQNLWGMGTLRVPLEQLFHGEAGGSFSQEYESSTSDRRILLIKGQALQADGHRVALVVMDDVTVRREAERLVNLQKSELETAVASAAITLDRTREELRSLTAHLFSVQEEERQKVARELHDDVSQRLSYLDLLLKDLPEEPEAEDGSKLNEARSLLRSLNNDVRLISHQLHPAVLDELGLSAALKVLVDEFGEREGMPANFLSEGAPVVSLQPASTALYRIAQEGLRNVAKHAGKTHVKVFLENLGHALRLQVVDLGVGFDQAERVLSRGLGLISMTERAHIAHGTLSITSTLGLGTTVVAEVPFDPAA